MSESVLQHAIKTAGSMIAFALVGTLMLAIIYEITKQPIADNEAKARLALFKQVLPSDSYDNDILSSTVTIEPNAQLGNKQTSIANIAFMNKKPVGMILEATAHDGYAGDIKLLVGIRLDGVISGVRVLTHKETPGLGDYIDFARDTWISIFDGQSLKKTASAQWKVKKDGGQFDYMVGATISPRAVVKKVHETLEFFKAEKKALLVAHKTQKNTEVPAGTIEEPIEINIKQDKPTHEQGKKVSK